MSSYKYLDDAAVELYPYWSARTRTRTCFAPAKGTTGENPSPYHLPPHPRLEIAMQDRRNNPVKDSDGEEPAGVDWAWVGAFALVLRRYFRLLGLILLVSLVIAAILYLILPRTYEASATVGPPGPSPTDTMFMSLGGSNVASHLLGGISGSSAGGPYDEFLQLLPSSRLAQVLISKYHLDRQIFYRQWDAQARSWKTGWLQGMKDDLKRLLGLPVVRGPTVDTLMQYLNKNLKVVGVSSGLSSALIPGTSTYSTVSFRFEDPQQAESILNTMLRATDQIIREDQRRDVTARISTLESELSEVTVSDERSSLIDILTNQEQLLTMIQADQRYASTLVVPPYASPKPISPTIVVSVILAFMCALLAWIAVVILALRFDWLHSVIAPFERVYRSEQGEQKVQPAT